MIGDILFGGLLSQKTGAKLPFTTIVIGTQEWTEFNLELNDYGGGVANGSVASGFGRMYTYAAAERVCANLVKSIDPSWRVPTISDWASLSTQLGSSAGGKLKSTGTSYWNSPNTGATNEAGFNARCPGYIDNTGITRNYKAQCYMWSSDDYLASKRCALLAYNSSSLVTSLWRGPEYYLPLRLVKDI